MAEGTTSSFDPVTGLHNKSTFQYDKVVPPRQGSMSNAQANAIVQALAQVDPAKALVFGMQLKGRMGYERDIAAGMTEKEAMARNGANIFFSNASAALKSMTPDPLAGTRMDTAKTRLDYDKARLEAFNRGGVVKPETIDGVRGVTTISPTGSKSWKPIALSDKDNDPIKLLNSAAALAESSQKFGPNDPMRKMLNMGSSNLLYKAEQLLNKPNPLSQAGQPARIAMPSGGTLTQQVTKLDTPEAKLQRANELRVKFPDLSKQDIIKMVLDEASK